MACWAIESLSRLDVQKKKNIKGNSNIQICSEVTFKKIVWEVSNNEWGYLQTLIMIGNLIRDIKKKKKVFFIFFR